MRVFAVFAALLAGCAFAPGDSPPRTTASSLRAEFQRAADAHRVPVEILQATGWVASRWQMRGGEPAQDGSVGIFGLTPGETGTLARAARLTGRAPAEIASHERAHLDGAAAVMREIADRVFKDYPDLDPRRTGDWYPVAQRFCDFPDARTADLYAQEVFEAVVRGAAESFPDGSTLELEPAPGGSVDFSRHLIFRSAQHGLSTDYPSARWIASPNFTAGRGGKNIDFVIIHTNQGSYAGTISWFQNASAQVSAHYELRSSDGEVTQMVRDADTGWHAGNWDYNQRSIGIEHEGYVEDPARWYTDAMYQSSANLTRWLCDTHGIPKDRTHIIGHFEVPDPYNPGQFGGASHHTDPGSGWDWNKYMGLVLGTAGAGTLKGVVADATGTNYDVRIAGATVRIVETGATTTASSTGLYTFTLAPGTYTPEACATGYQCASPGARTVAVNTDTWGSVRLAPSSQQQTGTLRGFIADASGNAYDVRIPGATVRIVETGQTTTADANGHYSFNLLPGSYTPEGSAAGFVTTRLGARSVVASNDTWGSIRLPPEASVKGTVTGFVYKADPANPQDRSHRLAGAALAMGGSLSTVSTGDGAFSFTNVDAGGYTLSAALDGYTQTSLSVNVVGGSTVSVEVGLQAVASPDIDAPQVTITEPAAGAVVRSTPVTVRGTLDDPSVSQVSVDGGAVAVVSQAFSVQLALTSGAHTILVTARDAAGNEGRAQVTVTYLPPETEGVSGYVYASATAARIEGAQISLGGALATASNNLGEFSLDAAAGGYTLTVSAAGFKTKTQPLTIAAQSRAHVVVGLDLDPGTSEPGGGTTTEYLRIDGPADSATLEDAEAVVTGQVKMAGLARVEVNSVEALVVDGAFSATVPLSEGENKLTARAWGSGDRMLETFIRVNHAAPPLKPPPAGGCGCGGGASAGADALMGLALAIARAVRPRRKR